MIAAFADSRTMLASFRNLALDTLFPKHSLQGREGEWVTLEEALSIHPRFLRLDASELRRMGMEHIDHITAACHYDDSLVLRRALWTFKYARIRPMGHILCDLIVLAAREAFDDESVVLCPVPLHWSRRFQRGFNQADVLARTVAKQGRGVTVRSLLKRVRSTGHQAHRHRDERLVAVRSAFKVRRSPLPLPDRVVLIDDLATTGSTLDACAATLKRAGVKTVEAVVIALG